MLCKTIKTMQDQHGRCPGGATGALYRHVIAAVKIKAGQVSCEAIVKESLMQNGFCYMSTA